MLDQPRGATQRRSADDDCLVPVAARHPFRYFAARDGLNEQVRQAVLRRHFVEELV